ncbi:unnamed protein product [Haemonchus placei]|uniref:EF-hand domain-containing protein n=1 Tax=Haemonchus placei TaxID=6290 RepID=A0A0N4W0Y9_HAEPC|nr:unnamed protein product [Haemonchus placei]
MYSVYPPKMRFEGSEMGSRSRGTYGSQQYRGGGGDDFFPRYDSNRARESTRTTRNAPAAPATYRGRVESEFRSARGYEADRKRDYPNGREMDRTKSINEKRSADTRYEGGRRGDARDVERSIHSRSNGNDRGAEARMSDSSGNRYKYLDEGWYNAYKPPTSISTYPEASHDYRTSRNGYESQPPTRDTRDRYRYGKEIVMETRQLEERVAAIQRELEMLEKDNVGSRSTDYRSSRNAYSANPSGNLPSLLDFAPPPDAVEKARIEREEVHLRMREEELRRREQELIMEQQRAIRQRAAPTTQYRRIAPPSRPKNATFPKLRSSITRRPVLTKRMNKSSSRRKLPERRRVEKTREKSRKDVKLPAKQKRTVKREVKEENTSKKKASGAEDPSKKSGHDRTTEGLIEQILGKYKREGLLPRTRYLKKLFEFCDVNLLEDELCREAAALIPKVQLPTKDDYKTRTCIRTYNPTVFGPLDQYVPLGLFEEEVKVHDIANDTESDKILADLRKALAGFPESSAA